ncbi:MAG: TIGR00282 family metallophosphoesterase [Candidatus Falkowbacteria bacterium]|nr:TIGR00282 family metallophosphoesterase [Candidatus Falkowbacteria bacterium]
MAEKPLSILFIGDIVGRLGRQAVVDVLPKLIKQHKPDLIIANGENLAHGKGITPTVAKQMFEAGIDWLTTGDHCFDQASSVEECFESNLKIIRPENYSADAKGKGHALIKVRDHNVLLINLLGRSFMTRHFDCPFRAAEKILASFTDKKISAIIIDIHAETTAEKIALRHFLDGKISALLGTHTHVPTADSQITQRGTGYITDIGMTGYADGVIGVLPEAVIESFLTQTKISHQMPDSGRAQSNIVKLLINPQDKKCLEIELIQKIITISS